MLLGIYFKITALSSSIFHFFNQYKLLPSKLGGSLPFSCINKMAKWV